MILDKLLIKFRIEESPLDRTNQGGGRSRVWGETRGVRKGGGGLEGEIGRENV